MILRHNDNAKNAEHSSEVNPAGIYLVDLDK